MERVVTRMVQRLPVLIAGLMLVGCLPLIGCRAIAAKPPQAPQSRYVHFDTGKDVPKSAEEQVAIGQAAGYLEAHPALHALLVGHTDSAGDPQRNKKLSFRRARGVREALLKQGIASERLTVAARGDSQPSGSNETEVGRAKNRRVEIFFFYPEQGELQMQYGAKIEIQVQ